MPIRKRPEMDMQNPPGQVINDIKLSDYIERKADAKPKKLSFDEWFDKFNKEHGMPPALTVAEAAWYAGQENK